MFSLNFGFGRNIISVFTFVAMLTMVLAGCSSSENGVEPEASATIEGRVTNDAGFNKFGKTNAPVDGAAVTVVQIQADGSLQTVSLAETSTNANGEFSVETDLDNTSGLIVVAQKGNLQWKSVVSSATSRGNTTRCQPHNDESTAEAEADEARAHRNRNGNNNGNTDYVDIANTVTAELAAELKGDASAAEAFVVALEAEADARIKALTDASVGATQSQLQTAKSARMQAQIELEVALNIAAGNAAATAQAVANFQDAAIDAYVDAGIAAEKFARSQQAAAKAMVKNSVSLSNSIQFRIKQAAHRKQSWANNRACETQFTALGAANAQLTAIANAAASFRASVDASANDSQLEAAVQAYHDAIISELQISASAHASAIVSLDAALNGVGGARLALIADVALAASTQEIVNAYIAFYNAVRTAVETTLTSASQTEINAITEVLVVANMSV